MRSSKFTLQSNVELFVRVLAAQAEPRNRALLNKLLLREETKLASLTERLEFCREHIHANARRISRQERLLEDLGGYENDQALALRVLDSLYEARHVLLSIEENIVTRMTLLGY